MNSSDVINTVDARFETDVMTRSQLGLVIVDFWAEWCGPCRMLGPVLEQVAKEYSERVTLVKADTEQNQAAAGRFGVTGIPAVYAILNEEVIDSFQGAMPEQAIRAWIDGCLEKEALFRVQQEMQSNPERAQATLQQMIEQESANQEAARVLLVQLLHQQGQKEEVEAMLEKLSQRGFLEPELEKIRSELSIQHGESVDLEALRKRSTENPEDLLLQFELAEALAAKEDYESAFEICLKLVEMDRSNTGEKARLLMLDVFRVLGDDSELTRDYRRRLSMVLY